MDVDQVPSPRAKTANPSRLSPKPAPTREAAPPPPPAAGLDPLKLAELVGCARVAIHNGETSEASDQDGRVWLICPDVADNRSVVLIRARKGGASAERSLSTALLGVSTQPAEDAITAICAALP